MLRKQILFFTYISFLTSVPLLRADQRQFVWTYEYQTMPKGEAEMENYYTASTPDRGGWKDSTTTEQQLELEVGMNDRFDFSLYQVFKQKPGAALRFEGLKLQTRYRLGEKEGSWIRPIIYLEYKSKPDFSEHEVEFKPIVGKTFGAYTLAVNPIVEAAFEDDEWKTQFAYSVGVGYKLGKLAELGLEATGGEKGHYIGPTISHGRENLWVALGSGFAVGEVQSGAAEMRIRFIVGIGVGKP